MSTFNFKTATPDVTFPSGGFLFGADSQSAATPSIYAGTTYLAHILGLANTWSATQSVATGSSVKLYNTADQTTNYERISVGWNTNVAILTTEKNGTGVNRDFKFRASGDVYIEPNNGNYTGIVRINSGNGFGSGGVYLNASVGFVAVASGVLGLADAAATSFDRINFGGTTSAFGAIGRDGAGVKIVAADGTTGTFLSGVEQTAPSAPAANGYRIFAQDNGAGKTQLMVIFGSGAAQQIAIEP